MSKSNIEIWPIANLTPYSLNVKKHDKVQVSKIATAITKFGWADAHAIIVDKNGVIIAGHGRRLAAIELGLKEVKVQVLTHLTDEQVRAYRLAENRVGVSDIDSEMLREEMLGLNDSLSGIFDEKELDFLSADLGEMNTDAFVTDMGAVLEEQRKDLDARAEAATSPDVRVPLSKAFGFKDVGAGGQIAIASMMSKAEARTGLKNDEALVAFARSLDAVVELLP